MARKSIFKKYQHLGLLLLTVKYLLLDVWSLSTCRILELNKPFRRKNSVLSVYSSSTKKDDETSNHNNNNDLDSPLSQLPDDEEYHNMKVPFVKNEKWLEEATDEFLDKSIIPLGALNQDDVESITGLMAAWVRRRSVDAALVVEQLLKRVVDDMRANNPDVHVTSRMYTIAIDAWAKSGGNAEAAHRAQNIHDAMTALYKQTGDEFMAPSSISYNTVMNAWSKCCHYSAPKMAEQLFQQMMEDPSNIQPDAITFSTLMDTYARNNSPNATHRAEELFHQMVELGVKRNVYTFSALQNVYARSGRRDAPVKTLGVLHRMLDLSQNGDVFAKPNCVTYNAVLNAYSRTPSKDSCQLANSMLEKMELPVEDGGYDVEPDRLSYALTILACSRCPDATFGSTIALANLEKMESRALLEERKRQQVSSAAPPSVSLDAECFNVVLTALSKSRSQEAVPRMLEIVERMEGYANSSDGNKYIRPTIRSWNAVLNGLSRSKEKGSAKKAEEILHHLFDLDAEGVPESKPDAFSFAAVLSAYQRTWNLAGIQRADDIVRKMEEWYERGILDKPPDVYHYTIVCAAWARVKGAQRCIQILNHMMERHKAGYPAVKPNARTYNAVLDALARSDEAEKSEQLLYHMLMLAQNGDEGARPDSFSFNAVINAYTRSKLRDGGKRAESVLDRFLEHSEEFPKVKPDIRSFTNIVAYYGRSKLLDAPYRAEYVLNRLVALYRSGYNHLAPNVFAVTTVIDSYAQHEHPDAGECAERLLRLMHKLRDEYGASELSINTGVMNSVLNAWASCGHDNAGKRANALLLDMEEKYEDGKSELKPNARSYCLVLSAWSKSLADNKAGKALEILNRMQSRYDEGKLNTRPGEHPHSLVINACAFTNSSPHTEEEAFKIAVQIMTKFSKTSHLQPSSVSFAWFLQACGRLTVPSGIKDDNVERAWQTCCDNGLVNDFVLSRLKGAASDAQFKELVRPALKKMNVSDKNIKQKISISHLPRDWTRKKRSLKGSSARDFSKGRKKERRVTKN